jgi:hypothetical protein
MRAEGFGDLQMTCLRTIEPVIVSFGSFAALLGTAAVLVALLFIT